MAETSDGSGTSADPAAPQPTTPQPTTATEASPVPIAIPADPPPIPVIHPLPTVPLPHSVVKWISGMGKYAKGVVAFLVVVVGGALAQGLIVGAAAAWVSVVIGALATVGVVAKANS